MLAVEPDEASNPVDLRLLGANAPKLETDLVPDVVEQSRASGSFHERECAPYSMRPNASDSGDSGLLFRVRLWAEWMTDCLFCVRTRMSTSR